MSWYKDYKREWKEIIETISREVNRTPQMIEKDTIQSMFLLDLSKSELPFVFKGGFKGVWFDRQIFRRP